MDQKLKALGDEAPETAPSSAKPAVLDPAAAGREIAVLKRKVESLENAIILKDAKLKEALSAVPSPEETQQLASLEANLSGLRQENANLKSAIDKATDPIEERQHRAWPRPRPMPKKPKLTWPRPKLKPRKPTRHSLRLWKRRRPPMQKRTTAKPSASRIQLADKQENLAKTEKELASLATAHKALESELKSFKKGSREKDLQAEVESLQKELSENQKDIEKTSGDVAALKSDKISLEEELKSFKKGNREKKLEAEVDSLEKQLTSSNSKLKETSSNLATAEISNDSLEDQLKSLQKGSREKEMGNYIISLEKRLAKAERKNTNPASKRKGA